MSKRNNKEAVGGIETVIEKYIRNVAMTAEEKRMLTDYLNQNPRFVQELVARRKAYSRAGNENARGNRPIVSGVTNSVTPLPGLNNALQHMNYNSRISSPGGFKKSGYDQDSQIRRAGNVTDQSDGNNTVRIDSRGRAEIGHWNAKGEFVRDRIVSAGEVDSVLRRSQSGATLSTTQQAIYDRVVQMRRQAAEDAAKKIADTKRREETEEERRAADQEDIIKQMRELEQEKKKLILKKQFDAEQREAKRIERNRSYGLQDDYELSDADIEAIKKGRKRVDYTDDDKKRMDELRASLRAEEEKGLMDQNAIEELRGRIEDTIKNNYHRKVVDVPDAPQSQPYYSDDGKMYWDGDKWVPYTQRDTTDEKKRSFILSRLKNDRTEHEKIAKQEFIHDSNNNLLTNPQYNKPFDENASIAQAQRDWDLSNGVNYMKCPRCYAEMPVGGECPVCHYVDSNDAENTYTFNNGLIDSVYSNSTYGNEETQPYGESYTAGSVAQQPVAQQDENQSVIPAVSTNDPYAKWRY